MILNFARPSQGAQVSSGNVARFGFLPEGSVGPTVGTGFQNPITTATHPRLLRFGFAPQGTLGQTVVHGGLVRRKRKTQTLAEFEAEQPKPFGRKWFEEFQAAELAAKQAAQTAPKKAIRKALEKLAQAATEVRREVELTPVRIDASPILAAFEAARTAKHVEKTIRASREAHELAMAFLEKIRREQEDEDDALAILLIH